MTVSKWPGNALIAFSLGLAVLSGIPHSFAATDTEALTKKTEKSTSDSKEASKAEKTAKKAQARLEKDTKKADRTEQKLEQQVQKAGKATEKIERTAAAKKASAKESRTASSTASDEASIREQLAGITRRLASGDAKGLSNIWADDASFIDSDGVLTKGREALEKKFAALIAANGRPHFLISPQNIRVITSNVALSDGLVIRQDGIAGPAPETRYSMVFVKQGGNWLISSATETELTPQTSHEPLQALSWMIGEWSAENNGGSVHFTADWAAHKRFIQCRFEMKASAESPAVESRQVIGFDPRTNEIVSWHFDSNGGFGYGTWTQRDRQWIVNATGVQPDGSTSVAHNLMTLDDSNGFSWQSVDRRINGIPVGDTKALKVQRMNKLSSK